MTWRERSRAIIARVLEETKGKSEAEIKKALFEACPYGPREYWPYKVWLDEIRIMRGLKKPKQRAFRNAVPVDPNQERMF